jgi:hypothetical protein
MREGLALLLAAAWLLWQMRLPVVPTPAAGCRDETVWEGVTRDVFRDRPPNPL